MRRDLRISRGSGARGLCLTLMLAWLAVCLAQNGFADSSPLPVVPNFRLLDHRGVSHELYAHGSARAVVLFFVQSGCPLSLQSYGTLRQLSQEYGPRGVTFLLVNSNLLEDEEDVAREAASYEVDLPILVDRAQLVAREFDTVRNGEAVVIVPGGWQAVYQGGLDDRLDPRQRRPARRHYLREALDAVLGGRPVAVPKTMTQSCPIDRVEPPEEISYSEYIAPLVASSCLRCHSSGRVAPFYYDRYEELAKRRGAIREVLLAQRMPPWKHDPRYGTFDDVVTLTPEQQRNFVAWLERGARRGDGPDPLPSEAERYQSRPLWALGEPDAVIAPPQPHEIPGAGEVDYVFFQVASPFDRDVWIRGVDIVPSNPSVVHHCLVYLEPPGGQRRPDMPRVDDLLAWYVPGTEPRFFPAGSGKRIPRGSTLVFALHYVSRGRPQVDQTSLGLYLCDSPPEEEYVSRAVVNDSFTIPAGEPAHKVRATCTLEEDVLLYEMAPHMHFRGKSFRYEADFPDGTRQVLLSVPVYEVDWQHVYRLSEPIPLPRGTRITCSGVFDNSEANPYNPDPTVDVGWGSQIWDEMFVGYLSYTRRR